MRDKDRDRQAMRCTMACTMNAFRLLCNFKMHLCSSFPFAGIVVRQKKPEEKASTLEILFLIMFQNIFNESFDNLCSLFECSLLFAQLKYSIPPQHLCKLSVFPCIFSFLLMMMHRTFDNLFDSRFLFIVMPETEIFEQVSYFD